MVTLPVLVVSLLFAQPAPRDPALAARISQLLHTMLTADDAEQERAAETEAKEIFMTNGLPTVADVGDEAAYEFVVLTCSRGPVDFQANVLTKAKAAVSRHTLASDAALYCEARLRFERLKARAGVPTHPALGEEIGRLFVSDQVVRARKDFDRAKMVQADREHEAALTALFEKYGVPTFTMVGTEAASRFVTLIQHQSPALRRKVLPKLKANVDAGQADPAEYAMVFDRSRRDAGRKQRYGENLECNEKDPTIHESPIEDEAHVDLRRARLGLMRVELYARLVAELSPEICRPPRP